MSPSASETLGNTLRYIPRQAAGVLAWLIPRTPEPGATPMRAAWLYVVFVVRRFLLEDAGLQMAAVLTLDTLLSLVPVLGLALVGVSMLDPHDGAGLLREIFQGLMPSTRAARAAADDVVAFAHNVTVGNLGTWGFLVVLGIAFMLFSTLEEAMNRVWRVTRRRNLVLKFTMFYTVATLGPLLVLYSVQQSLVAHVSRSSIGAWGATLAGAVLVHRWLPNTHVHWRAALGAGLFTTASFEAGKAAFAFYVQRIAVTYEGLYGPVAIVPLFLVWSYVSWSLLLLGAQVGFVMQNHRSVRLQGFVLERDVHAGFRERGASRTAARLLLAVADNFDQRNTGIPREQLAERFELPVGRVSELMARLDHAGFVLEAEAPHRGYVPARPLDRIRLAEVLEVFDGEEAERTRRDGLDEIFGRLDDARATTLGDLDYAHLVARARGRIP